MTVLLLVRQLQLISRPGGEGRGGKGGGGRPARSVRHCPLAGGGVVAHGRLFGFWVLVSRGRLRVISLYWCQYSIEAGSPFPTVKYPQPGILFANY